MPTAAEYEYEIACLKYEISQLNFVNANRKSRGWEYNEARRRWESNNPKPVAPLKAVQEEATAAEPQDQAPPVQAPEPAQ